MDFEEEVPPQSQGFGGQHWPVMLGELRCLQIYNFQCLMGEQRGCRYQDWELPFLHPGEFLQAREKNFDSRHFSPSQGCWVV